jgi:hypothetical protein
MDFHTNSGRPMELKENDVGRELEFGIATCMIIESLTLEPWWFVFVHRWGAHCD